MAGSALSACGGGGGLAGLPGTGGTGSPLFAQGTISGFGSVIINGITFNDLQAVVKVDGLAATSADLRLGMVASVQGQRGAGAALALAGNIDVWSLAKGVVGVADASGFSVNGMVIQIDQNTVLEGIGSSAQIKPGQTASVWGLQAGTDGSLWRATRVAVQAAPGHAVSSGLISVRNSQRVLNGLVLSGDVSNQLVIGALVRLQGVLSLDGRTLAVTDARSIGTANTAQALGDAEIEGFVTAVSSATRFTLGSVDIDTSNASFNQPNTAVSVGVRLEVYGTWASGVLKASKVEFEDEQTLQTVEIKAVIEQFSSLASFVLRGQRCDATLASISGGTASDLRIGVKIKAKGLKAGELLKVTSIEFDD